MAYPHSRNPFADDDDEEETAGSRSRGGGGFNFDDEPPESNMTEAERRQRYLQQEVMRTAQSAVDSSHRSLGLLYEAEKVGTDTAEELMRQGEALKRTERMVDGMEQDLRTSQRHINSIKSVWGGLVNYFKAKPEPAKPPPTKDQPTGYQANSKLQNALSESKQQEDKYEASHPNLRKLDTSGFGASASSDPEPPSSSQNGYPSQNRHLKAAHQKLDNNLDEMSLGLSRLKNLGLGLQNEIEDQDVALDSLLNKVDSMDGRIGSTNRQLKKL
ncbi:synaptosomal-associated protein 29 [Engraulis encrasicolus]|uniref:synaptosomal-associated protein 29 n=1 Tax=Engraulis encrasicolus TaxID=184585 RepID=UPI002FD4BE0F